MNFVSRKTIVKKLLSSKTFRDAYVAENIKRVIPFQVRTMRDEREWSQERAGQELGKPQNVISRFESPTYGRMTVQTLQEIARGFDVGLIIKFVPFSRLVKEYEDVSFVGLSALSVSDDNEARALEEWAKEEDEIEIDIPKTIAATIFKPRGKENHLYLVNNNLMGQQSTIGQAVETKTPNFSPAGILNIKVG